MWSCSDAVHTYTLLPGTILSCCCFVRLNRLRKERSLSLVLPEREETLEGENRHSGEAKKKEKGKKWRCGVEVLMRGRVDKVLVNTQV